MARSHRFHLDRDGHSVTVQTGPPSGMIELLVDGKVVAARPRLKDVTALAAELPGDPPQPFTVYVGQSEKAGVVPACLWEVGGHRRPIPYAPLGARRSSSVPGDAGPHPLRWLRRAARRRLRHLGVRHR
ncbi:hypothetical protein ACWDV7_37745 [Streptomyces sp. NPDC003362]